MYQHHITARARCGADRPWRPVAHRRRPRPARPRHRHLEEQESHADCQRSPRARHSRHDHVHQPTRQVARPRRRSRPALTHTPDHACPGRHERGGRRCIAPRIKTDAPCEATVSVTARSRRHPLSAARVATLSTSSSGLFLAGELSTRHRMHRAPGSAGTSEPGDLALDRDVWHVRSRQADATSPWEVIRWSPASRRFWSWRARRRPRPDS
jgi:hypothetical protein